MDYFYCPPEHIHDSAFLIDGDECAHLVHVMRKKEGDEIRIVDGIGNAFDARIEAVKHKTVRGAIIRAYENHHEPERRVTIASGVLKNPSKFDFLVEKVTEIGVRGIVPILTERTIASHAKVERWQKLALAAMKQSGRSFLPRVHELTRLADLIADDNRYDVKLVAHERARADESFFNGWPQKVRSVVVMIGPEGGFTDEEVERCRAAGFSPVQFGERRLRSETAAIVAATLSLQCELPH